MLKTTEIVIEQLIIGLLFLAILALFIFGSIWPMPYMLGGEYAKFIVSVIVVIAAYASGIVIDRIADTLLDGYLKHRRLQAGLGRIKVRDKDNIYWDIFPENRIRISMLKHGKEIIGYHDYLRTRMRITRALACLLPALLMALLLTDIGSSEDCRFIIGGVTATLYIITLLYSDHYAGKIPRTNDFHKLMEYLNARLEKENNDDHTVKVKLIPRDYICSPMLGLLVYTIIQYIVIFQCDRHFSKHIWILTYPLASTVATLIVGWVWWRITKTFLTYILDYKKL